MTQDSERMGGAAHRIMVDGISWGGAHKLIGGVIRYSQLWNHLETNFRVWGICLCQRRRCHERFIYRSAVIVREDQQWREPRQRYKETRTISYAKLEWGDGKGINILPEGKRKNGKLEQMVRK